MKQYSQDKINSIREEIISVCEELYHTMSFKDISIKEIGNKTTCTRTSIYNYFQNKEEIFLALMEREYDRWVDELNEMIDNLDHFSVNIVSDILAKTLSNRPQLLKLLAMNLYDIETNSSIEALTTFKRAYASAVRSVQKLVSKLNMNQAQTDDFIYSFFPFIFGIYPYTQVTEKQKTAMKQACFEYIQPSVYEIIYKCVNKLLEETKCAQ